MTRPGPGHRSGPDRHPVRVQVCRGCCCGNPARHPSVDHEALLDRLRDEVRADAGVRLRTTGCLGPCSSANVVIVRHLDRAVWLGGINDEALTDAVARWARAGGPAPSGPPLPALLAAHLVHPRDLEWLDVDAAMIDQRPGGAHTELPVTAPVAVPVALPFPAGVRRPQEPAR